MPISGLEIPVLLFVVKMVFKSVPPNSTASLLQEGRTRLAVACTAYADAKAEMDMDDRREHEVMFVKLHRTEQALTKLSGIQKYKPSNCWKAHKFNSDVEMFETKINALSCDIAIANSKKARELNAQECDALARMNAAKNNSVVQSTAAKSGFTADDCDYFLITKEKIYFDGDYSASRSSKPLVVIKHDNHVSIHTRIRN